VVRSVDKPFLIISAIAIAGCSFLFLCNNYGQLNSCSVPAYAASPASDLSAVSIGATGTVLYGIHVVNVFPHDADAFTQGLVFHKGYIYEGTGLAGQSSIRKVDLKTGKILKRQYLPAEYFGEGITIHGNRLVQLTWQSHTGFVYDIKSFRLLRTFSYLTEGWGITCDGNYLIMSDGTDVLRFLDPRTYDVVKQIEVRDRGNPLPNLNELEFVKGEIYANVWGTAFIVRISPRTGRVLGWIDLRELYRYINSGQSVDVLNGIAYDSSGDRLFVTGKCWPHLFEIQLVRSK